MRLNKKAASLILVLITVLIIGISANIGILSFRYVENLEKYKELNFSLKAYSRAIFLYKEKYKKFPKSINDLIKKKLLRTKYTNPFSKKNDFLFLKKQNGEIYRVITKYPIYCFYIVKRKRHELKYTLIKNKGGNTISPYSFENM